MVDQIFTWNRQRKFSPGGDFGGFTLKSQTHKISIWNKRKFSTNFFLEKFIVFNNIFSSKRSYSTVLVYSKNSFWDVPALKMVSFVLARFPPKIFSCLKKRSLCKCQRATKFFWNTKCVLGNAFLFVSFSFLFWERSVFFFFSLPNFLHLSLQ
jgi:hypothetical protein